MFGLTPCGPAPAPGDADTFSTGVSVSGDLMATGAENDDIMGGDSGTMFVFEHACPTANCTGDLNLNGFVDAADLSMLLGSWGTDNQDITGDGMVNGADLSVLL